MNLFVTILYNEPTHHSIDNRHKESELGVLNEVKMVEDALYDLNIPYNKAGIRKLSDLEKLKELSDNTVIINLVENLPEDLPGAFNNVPKICTEMGLLCTGNSSETLTLTFNKKLTKMRLNEAGIKTPKDIVIKEPEEIGTISPSFSPPWIVKPCAADGSEGIDADTSFIEREEELWEKVATLYNEFGEVIIEEYIDGREINQAVWEFEGKIIILPPAEIDFSLFPANRKHIVDYAVKWRQGTIPHHISPRKIPAELEPALKQRISEIAERSFIACKASDYVRIDMRVDANGEVFVLEVNANPDISPQAGFPAALKAAGIEFKDFIFKLILNAMERKRT